MTTPAPTVEGRLLCASYCTYSIDGSGTLPTASLSPFYDGAGFTQPPATFGGGIHNINACLVGSTADGVVLAFRGTLPLADLRLLTLTSLDALLDWMNDFNADLISASGLPGLVHAGFWGSLESLWPAAHAEVQRQLAQIPAGQLFITGHSKGGGIAPLAAMRFLTESITARVVTFAAPKCGDEDFAAAYNPQINHERYEYADDIVPHLPPSAKFLDLLSKLPFRGDRFANLRRFDYEAVGTLEFIDWSRHFVADSPALETVRFLSLARLIATGQFRQIALDHSIDCGSGYTTAVCPSGVCP
jgi:hypothetical protein